MHSHRRIKGGHLGPKERASANRPRLAGNRVLVGGQSVVGWSKVRRYGVQDVMHICMWHSCRYPCGTASGWWCWKRSPSLEICKSENGTNVFVSLRRVIWYATTPSLVMLTCLHVYLDLDLGSNFEIGHIVSKLAYFYTFWWKKHDGVISFALSLIDSKLFRKTCFDENYPF